MCIGLTDVAKGFGKMMKFMLLILYASNAPWLCLGAVWIGGDARHGSLRDLIAWIVVSIGFIVNAVVAIVCLHVHGTLGAFEAWEAALLGWAAGMTGLLLADIILQRAAFKRASALAIEEGADADAAYKAGGDAGEQSGKSFDCALVGALGVEVASQGDTYMWSYPAGATLPALPAFLIAQSLLQMHTFTALGLAACLASTCWHTAALYGVVRCFANYMVWCSDGVKKKEAWEKEA